MKHPIRKSILVWAGAAALLTSATICAQPTDTAVKAAFLPRFARYVTWPSAAMPQGNNPFVLCVVGVDPFGALLDETARSQTVDGRGIAVRRMSSPAGSDSCNIAFVSGGRGQSAAEDLAGLGKRPILTVTDSGNGSSRGIIHFVVEGGRVRFFIDQSAAAQRGLAVSSRLLALAIGVKH